MSDTLRNVLTVVMVVLMAVAAFAAGFLSRDFAEARMAGNGAVAADFALLDEAWSLVERNYIGDAPPSSEIAYGAIRGSLGVLGDPYTFFVEPQASRQEMERLRGNFGGIGATISRSDAGELVLEPIPGNPAEAAGIRSGDVLLAVDGVALAADLPVPDVGELIKGEIGTPVTLTVRHRDADAPVDIIVTRGEILIPSVWSRLLDEDPTIGYLQLTRFSGESGNEVGAALRDLIDQGATRLIIDVRGNGGGIVDAAVAVSSNFVGDVPVLIQVSQDGGEEVVSAESTPLVPDLPLVILIDGGTASASEIVAGALQDLDRAVLIGQKTFGKGSVQNIFTLSDGSAIHVTSARWYTPSRQPIDQVGLTPDIPVEPGADAHETGRDDMLQRAIVYLQTGS